MSCLMHKEAQPRREQQDPMQVLGGSKPHRLPEQKARVLARASRDSLARRCRLARPPCSKDSGFQGQSHWSCCAEDRDKGLRGSVEAERPF